jgi:hypothetical protein
MSVQKRLEDKIELELLIDRNGLNWLIEQTANICHSKAEHIEVNYSPSRRFKDLDAAAWNRAGNRLDRMKAFSV